MSKSPTLVHDLEALCQKHNITSAVLVIPQADDDFVLITRAITRPILQSLGRMLVKHVKPDPNQLN